MKKVNLQATTKPLSGAALGLALEQVASVFRERSNSGRTQATVTARPSITRNLVDELRAQQTDKASYIGDLCAQAAQEIIRLNARIESLTADRAHIAGFNDGFECGFQEGCRRTTPQQGGEVE